MQSHYCKMLADYYIRNITEGLCHSVNIPPIREKEDRDKVSVLPKINRVLHCTTVTEAYRENEGDGDKNKTGVDPRLIVRITGFHALGFPSHAKNIDDIN
ncbi:Uncharacterized protein TCM_034854 [Theobroma cacao]|uniref:Uncharacterized protein n=1 Tax=Theobroma cacao TaxID=3641 RepID=A0A061FGT0_THECC|nr:Uncharacterized protein TCM_034854 [Theobroma cacao]